MEFMETSIKWYDTAHTLPAHSGRYLVISKSGNVSILDYSKRHESFNCSDYDDNLDYKIDVAFWSPLSDNMRHLLEIADII